MKKIILYTTILFAAGSCSKVMDIPNLNSYDPSQVWTDVNLANAYIGNIYSLAFGNWNVGADVQSDQLAGIAFPAEAVTVTNGGLGNWNYTQVRLINQGIQSTVAGTLPQDIKNGLLGQLYFLRAYTYFGMVRTYGGVPIIRVPQDRYKDSLNIPRNTTAECFDFMIQDIDSAISLLPAVIAKSSPDWGRIDGSFALAFKAKVLLYKASPQFNPSAPWNNTYWQAAYTVNKQAYDELKANGYALIQDYSQVALSEKNNEIVFAVINLYPNKVASWDHGARPGSLSRGNAATGPTWEMVKAFPMKDGKRYNDPSGAYYISDAQLLQSYWRNRDPRFEAAVLWNAKEFPVAGATSGYRQYTSLGVADALDNYGLNPNSSERSQNNNRYTGFFIRKHLDLSLTQAQVQQYAVDFVVMRFAEVMLNYAEAANETGHTADALTILKEIRQRAGLEPGAGGNYGISATSREQTREAIMAERNIELCFEGFRFGDLRRWRMFSVLNNDGTKHGVEAIPVNPDGTEMNLTEARKKALRNELVETDFKYLVQQAPQSGVLINVLPEKYYFAPIQQSIIAAGNKIEQNRDWGGTFDPTLE